VANDQRQWLTGTHVEQVGADGKLSPIDWSKKSDAEVGASYNYMHQVMDAATANHLWSMVGVAATVTFGHGARHLAGTGLNQGAVESAIQKDVEMRPNVRRTEPVGVQEYGRICRDIVRHPVPSASINFSSYRLIVRGIDRGHRVPLQVIQILHIVRAFGLAHAPSQSIVDE